MRSLNALSGLFSCISQYLFPSVLIVFLPCCRELLIFPCSNNKYHHGLAKKDFHKKKWFKFFLCYRCFYGWCAMEQMFLSSARIMKVFLLTWIQIYVNLHCNFLSGNQNMQSKLYPEAIDLYACAIALSDKNAIYYCNRWGLFFLVEVTTFVHFWQYWLNLQVNKLLCSGFLWIWGWMSCLNI